MADLKVTNSVAMQGRNFSEIFILSTMNLFGSINALRKTPSSGSDVHELGDVEMPDVVGLLSRVLEQVLT